MNNNNFVLYLHIAPNGKKYFGITCQRPKKRWSNGHGYKGQDFYEAIEEFGWQNIEHYILADDLTRLEARMFEVMTIAIYNTRNPLYGYNDSPGGGIQSEETRKKMSEAKKGEKHHMYGKHHTEETRKKISKANKGKVRSEEHKQKISKTLKGKHAGKNNHMYGKTGHNNPTSKAVICITTGQYFGSAREAGRWLNVYSGSNISLCCKGKRNYSGKLPDGRKLVWRYLNHKHNNIYRISGGYFVDNEKIARLIEESFDSEGFDLDSWQLFDDVDDAPIDYENLSDII